MFNEYNMALSPRYSTYYGFTQDGADDLYQKYQETTSTPSIQLKELEDWYVGYETAGGIRIYNPRSVVRALSDNHVGSYWTSSGPYDEIFFYIQHNIDDIRGDLVRMAAKEEVPAKISEYAAVSMELGSKDEILKIKNMHCHLADTLVIKKSIPVTY